MREQEQRPLKNSTLISLHLIQGAGAISNGYHKIYKALLLIVKAAFADFICLDQNRQKHGFRRVFVPYW